MNYLWGGMLLLGILYGAFTGNLSQVTESTQRSTVEAVTLCISMAGITGFWCGLMKIAEHSGLIEKITEKIRAAASVSVSGAPRNHPAGKAISLNMIANFLGLGLGSHSRGAESHGGTWPAGG